jgi:hypothetical protein
MSDLSTEDLGTQYNCYLVRIYILLSPTLNYLCTYGRVARLLTTNGDYHVQLSRRL